MVVISLFSVEKARDEARELPSHYNHIRSLHVFVCTILTSEFLKEFNFKEFRLN